MWFTALCMFTVIPLGMTPALVSATVPTSMLRSLVYLYPLYLIATAAIAWYIYNERRPLAWILLSLSLLTTAAILSPLYL